MSNQIIRRDDTVNLNSVTFEKDGFMFDTWNTERDGTGTNYNDAEEIINLAEANKSITLYAQWMQGITYFVRYNANGGTGTMGMQEFTFGLSQNLNGNLFTKTDNSFVRWNTSSDNTGTNYENNESVKNLTRTENDIIDLYAIWAEEYYSFPNEYIFDGTNYIDTGIQLFNSTNINKDFEISFEIVSHGSNSNQATMVSCMDETGSPWPGLVFRVANGNQDELIANVTTSTKVNKYYPKAEIKKVVIKRKNGIIYVNSNDTGDVQALDMTSLTTTFDVPLTIGASLNASGSPQRYFKGTLKNLKVILYS